MYKIEKKDFGFKLTFEGYIEKEEMQNWFNDSINSLKDITGDFGVFVDMRNFTPLPTDAQDTMKEGQKLYKQKGMLRSVVILNRTITKLQFQRIGRSTGIYEWERYIDASSTKDWEQVGLDWINNEIDPDK